MRTPAPILEQSPRTGKLTNPYRPRASYSLRYAVLILAIGGFTLGLSEFVVMGLMPQIATDLGVAETTVGHGVAAYALGVVVGAPLITVGTARIGRKRLVAALAGLILIANLATILAAGSGMFIFSRFLAGMPHGAFFGVASVIVASLVPADRRGRTIAQVMLGLMIANLAGVPVATWLGQLLGWRIAYLLVVALAVVTMIGIVRFVPPSPATVGSSGRRELSAFTSPRLWAGLTVGAVGFAGVFTVYSYITPIVTRGSGVADTMVPIVLALFGLGMTLGAMVGGRLADWSIIRGVLLALVSVMVTLTLIGSLLEHTLTAYLGVFALGFTSSLLGPPLQLLLMDAAPQAQSMAAAAHHAAFNLANAIGAITGGAVIAGGDLAALPLTGAGFAACGLLLGSVALLTARTRHRRSLAASRQHDHWEPQPTGSR